MACKGFFNARRGIFKDKRVHETLFYAFDFEWANKNLFFSQYKRTTSFFSNSIYASPPLPSSEEKFCQPLMKKFR
ncbi:ABC-type oligopeptide transport system,periplasmic component fragment 3 [Helicobacter acinonychis str. Sheeba]|uniref:ABC-type oligopeptide transport system,periplasmic component 3 n=1 Tax=Helicobacter acinonychis (strain Sheeba) TaxID=382638 RepID=Q17Z42_HELAH|nr:ABC-type oligopeptide transport system,periplasmic component fragment 3 [Helicobacter acinonychis str. Sheeba]